MGAGAGRFGHFPFGRYPFGESVFLDSLPGYYQSRDTAGRLAALQRAKAYVADILFQKVEDFSHLRDPDRVRTREDTLRPLLLGREVIPEGVVIRRGGDGACYAGGEFSSPSARFTASDVGRVLRLLSSGAEPTRIVAVVSTAEVLLSPAPATNAGPLRWEIRDTPDLPGVLVEVVGDLSGVPGGWQILDGYQSFTLEGRWAFPSKRGPFYRATGAGTVASGVLTAPGATFAATDVGSLILLAEAAEEDGELAYIHTVLTTTTAVVRRADYSGGAVRDRAVHWFLRQPARILLAGRTVPRGVVLASGADAVVTTPGTTATLTVPSAAFVSSDVGRWVTLYPALGSSTGIWHGLVQSVVSSTVVTALSAVAAPAWTSVRWELRDAPLSGRADPFVYAAGPDLLQRLAGDSGLTLDIVEEPWRRRYYVDTFSQWSGQRATALGYAWMKEITGQTATVSPLYRIRTPYVGLFLSSELVEVSSTAEGKSGTAGSLSVYSGPLGAGRLQFTDAAARFDAADTGRLIHVTVADISANERYFTIDAVTSATTVVFRPSEPGYVETGTLTWGVSELYTDRPPTRVFLDEVNTDVVEEVRDPTPPPDTFWADGFGWQTDFGTSMTVTITARASAGGYRWRVSGTGLGWRAVVAVGWWKVTAAGVDFWLETVPVETGGVYDFDVLGAAGPTVGTATLTYVPRANPEPDYCPVPVVLLDVNVASGATGLARFLRLVDRVENQALPAHASLVVRQIV